MDASAKLVDDAKQRRPRWGVGSRPGTWDVGINSRSFRI
jgi:hypothetical protein